MAVQRNSCHQPPFEIFRTVGVTQGGGVDARRTPLDGRVPDVSVKTMRSLLEELLRPYC